MKALKVLIVVTLLASVAANFYLSQELLRQRADAEAARAAASEMETLRAESEALKKQSTARSPGADNDARDLARLRNEIGQLRQQATEARAAVAAEQAKSAQLQSQLTAAAQKMEELMKGSAELLKMTPEQMAVAKQRGEAIRCVNNMKQIGLAARLYANDHANTFPPDLATMKDELVTPKILFCPSAPGGVQAANWNELNPATISYQFLNPNGNESDPQKPLTFCPLHNNVGYSDGSVQMNRKQPGN